MTRLDRIPRALWFAVACGVLMVLPTATAGLFMDDVLVRVKLLELQTPWSPAPWWDLYTFAREDINATLLAAGHHPWWADPEVKMTFFRPLSAATHVLDYMLWPDSPALQHLHSVLWYGLAVALAVTLFRRLHQGATRVAALAGLIFAVATPHVMAVGWLAGRNTLISFVVGCLLIRAHLRWRTRGDRRFLAGAAMLLILGLFTGEAILGALGYVIAWQVCMDRALWRARLRALIPYVAIVGVWRWLYVMAGFGAAGTGIYHDPGSDLLDFSTALATNLPVLLLGRWLPVPLDVWAILPTSAHVMIVGAALLFIGALTVLFWSLLTSSAVARFWGLGMVLSLIPFTATVPMDRLVLFAGLGSAGLLGLFTDTQRTRSFARWAGTALLVIHIPLAVTLGLTRASTLSMNFAPNTSGMHQAPRDRAVPDQTFVYVAGTFHRTHYTTLMRTAAGDPAVPRRSVILSSMLSASSMTRVDADTIEIAPEGGFMARTLDRIHRRVTAPFSVGQTVPLPDLTVEVTALMSDGRPARAAFHFRVPLEHPSLRWLQVAPQDDALLPLSVETRPFTVPAVGETVWIAPVL